ncbi:hypothetical protein [Micromonospora peucetia]|uniref:Uncharacterized protein n=1 Tax=Micromonospora peucetia TaxID=47871 RepID=A0A1C6VJ25_9ACTN|nr:hypothetical protein [Micromonospora peucetia]SCL66282.1 hypothetical protein GA0070608_3258 [Micromonospora peucetia]
MAKHRASGDVPSTREGVTEGPDTAYWSVDDSRWRAVRPDLPDHMVDLLAPPIVVGVARVPITSRLTPPADLRSTPPVELRSTPPADSRSTAPVASAGSRRIVPAGPGAPGRRPAGAATPSGRHRRAAGRPDRTA